MRGWIFPVTWLAFTVVPTPRLKLTVLLPSDGWIWWCGTAKVSRRVFRPHSSANVRTCFFGTWPIIDRWSVNAEAANHFPGKKKRKEPPPPPPKKNKKLLCLVRKGVTRGKGNDVRGAHLCLLINRWNMFHNSANRSSVSFTSLMGKHLALAWQLHFPAVLGCWLASLGHLVIQRFENIRGLAGVAAQTGPVRRK